MAGRAGADARWKPKSSCTVGKANKFAYHVTIAQLAEH